MKAITRYILIQLVTATAFVTIGLTFAIWLTQSLRLIDYIVNRGLPATTFLTLIGLLLPSFLGVVLPVAAFCATLFIYNKLAADSELVVLRAAGLSQIQLARPAIVMAILATLAVLSITLYFLPASYQSFKVLQFSIRNNYSAILLQEGVFNTLSDDITVFVRERTTSGELRGILVHDSRDRAKPVTMMAESGVLVPGESGPRVVMVNGNRQEVERDSGRLSLLYFDRYTVEVARFSEAASTRRRDPKELYLHELFDPASARGDDRYGMELIAEGHQRLVAPIYTLTFIMVGLAALLSGEFNRRGQTRRILAAIICVAALESISLALHDMANRSPQIIPAMYAAPVFSIFASLIVLVRKPRRKIVAPPVEVPA